MNTHRLLERNRDWVSSRKAEDPTFFERLASEHRPQFLWIGCADARVPANVITGTPSGEMFVHRNIANLVVPTDQNLLAVLQYAVEVLGVRDIIVCGHLDCGGVKAAMGPMAPPQVEHWLANIRNVARLHAEELEMIDDPLSRHARLVELNVAEQVYNLSRTPVVRRAWEQGDSLRLHGWVYDIREGLLRDLQVLATAQHDVPLPARVRPASAASAA